MKMVSRKISAIYTVSLLFISILLLTFFFGFLFLHYDSLVSWVVRTLKKPELEGLLRHRVFTMEKFRLLQKISLAALFIFPFVVLALYKARNFMINRLVFIWVTIRDAFNSWILFFRLQSRREKIILFLVLSAITVRSIFYILNRDLQYDEMWSYNYFTVSPFYYTFFMYNNYPFYELTTHFFRWLPFPQKINMRLPVLFTGMLSIALLYYNLFRLFKNQMPALLGVILFACCPPVSTYMIYGRGVIFEIFFAIMGFFSLLQWLDEQNKNNRAALFILSCILGNYAMPTHIYCWFCLIIFAILYGRLDKTGLLKFIHMNAWILAGTFLCYLPVLLGSGFSFLTSILTPQETFHSIWFRLPEFYGILSFYITGFYTGLVFVFLICLLIFFQKKKMADYFPVILFCLILCLFPFLIYLVQRIRIPERAQAFLVMILPLTAALLMDRYGNYFHKKIQYTVLLVSGITAVLITHFNLSFNWNRKIDTQVRELSLLFLNNGITSCYDSSSGSNFSYYYPGLEYYYKQEGKTIRLILGDPASVKYKPFSASDPYDCIVLHANPGSGSGIPGNRMPIYRKPEEGFEIFINR